MCGYCGDEDLEAALARADAARKGVHIPDGAAASVAPPPSASPSFSGVYVALAGAAATISAYATMMANAYLV